MNSRLRNAIQSCCGDPWSASVLWKEGPSAPPQPDYAAAAQAQGAANEQAARITGRMNSPNVNNPYGTQTVTWGKADPAQQAKADELDAWHKQQFGVSIFDPTVNPIDRQRAFQERGIDLSGSDQPTITQQFSPEQQGLYDQSVRVKGLLGSLGQQGAEAMQGIVGKSFDISGAPAVGTYEGTRKKVIDAMMGRADEDYGRATDQANSSLISAGIRPGTKAYADKMQMIERSRNDARSQAEVAGGNAASQAYTMDADRRRAVIAEILAQRQTPLNEVSALMSGSQVSNPFSVPGAAQNNQVAPRPEFNAAMQASDYNTDLYNAKVGQGNATIGALGNVAGAAAMAFF